MGEIAFLIKHVRHELFTGPFGAHGEFDEESKDRSVWLDVQRALGKTWPDPTVLCGHSMMRATNAIDTILTRT